MNLARLTGISAGVSAVLALLAAYATILLDVTPQGLLGSVWYGYPVAWAVRAVVAPQYNPWSYDYFAFAEDALFWFVVAFVVMYVAMWAATRGPERKTPQSL